MRVSSWWVIEYIIHLLIRKQLRTYGISLKGDKVSEISSLCGALGHARGATAHVFVMVSVMTPPLLCHPTSPSHGVTSLSSFVFTIDRVCYLKPVFSAKYCVYVSTKYQAVCSSFLWFMVLIRFSSSLFDSRLSLVYPVCRSLDHSLLCHGFLNIKLLSVHVHVHVHVYLLLPNCGTTHGSVISVKMFNSLNCSNN